MQASQSRQSVSASFLTFYGAAVKAIYGQNMGTRRLRDDGGLFAECKGYRDYQADEVIEILGVGVGFFRMGRI